jgi:hypothetical protein
MNDQHSTPSRAHTGGPAFPIPDGEEYLGEDDTTGMSLRDYFAAHAVGGVLALGVPSWSTSEQNTDDIIADRCYRLADAMLRARAK